MEFRLKVPEQVIREWQTDSNGMEAPDLLNDAMKLFNWAVMESKEGRVIQSTDDLGQNAARVHLPSLERIAQRNIDTAA